MCIVSVFISVCMGCAVSPLSDCNTFSSALSGNSSPTSSHYLSPFFQSLVDTNLLSVSLSLSAVASSNKWAHRIRDLLWLVLSFDLIVYRFMHLVAWIIHSLSCLMILYDSVAWCLFIPWWALSSLFGYCEYCCYKYWFIHLIWAYLFSYRPRSVTTRS